eukprot:gene13088-13191_t
MGVGGGNRTGVEISRRIVRLPSHTSNVIRPRPSKNSTRSARAARRLDDAAGRIGSSLYRHISRIEQDRIGRGGQRRGVPPPISSVPGENVGQDVFERRGNALRDILAMPTAGPHFGCCGHEQFCVRERSNDRPDVATILKRSANGGMSGNHAGCGADLRRPNGLRINPGGIQFPRDVGGYVCGRRITASRKHAQRDRAPVPASEALRNGAFT